MELKLNAVRQDPVTAESSAVVERDPEQVFSFIADRFYDNYPRWMTDVVELDLIDPEPIRKGSRLRQVRLENDENVTSTFAVTDYGAYEIFSFEGLDMPYRQIYRINPAGKDQSEITFRFELLEVDLFMRPFVKLIRSAMSEGVDSTMETLTELLSAPNTSPP